MWRHHFGPTLVEGRDIWEGEVVDEKKKMIARDTNITNNIFDIHKQLKALEENSRRPDRSTKVIFLKKKELFLHQLDLPFYYSKRQMLRISSESLGSRIGWKRLSICRIS